MRLNMIVNTVICKTKGEFKNAFIDQMREISQIVLSEEGCITYELFEDPRDGSRFFLFEEWDSQEALEKHLQQPHMQKHFAKVNDWFRGEILMTTYEVKSQSQQIL